MYVYMIDNIMILTCLEQLFNKDNKEIWGQSFPHFLVAIIIIFS